MAWKIEKTESYYYQSGRNSKTYEEITFWYDDETMERKESKRSESIYYGEEYKLPDWAKCVTVRNRSLESDRVY